MESCKNHQCNTGFQHWSISTTDPYVMVYGIYWLQVGFVSFLFYSLFFYFFFLSFIAFMLNNVCFFTVTYVEHIVVVVENIETYCRVGCFFTEAQRKVETLQPNSLVRWRSYLSSVQKYASFFLLIGHANQFFVLSICVVWWGKVSIQWVER